jgi:hypothetical protein
MVVAVAVLGYGLLALYIHAVKFNVVVSDCAMYNRWSHGWWDFSQRCPTQMPLYPVMLWVFRCLTFNLLGAGALMQVAALLFAAGSYFYVYKILRLYLPEAHNIGFVIFGLYPFVGLWYAFDPRADTLAIFCLAGAAYYSLGQRWPLFALCAAAALLTHKAVWPFVVLLSVDALWRKKCPLYWPLLALVPLAGFWAWGLSQGQNALWLLSGNLKGEVASKSALPIMDGLLGTFLAHRSMAKLIKACVVLALFLLSAGLSVWNLRRLRQPDSLFNLALLLPIVFLTVVLNQYEIWAAVRFSQAVAIPLAAFFVAAAGLRRFFERPAFFLAAALACLLTNALFCYYATKLVEAT